MKLLILLLFPISVFSQTTLVAHGNTLWLKNTQTNDSSRVVTERKLTDSLGVVRTTVIPSTRLADSMAVIRAALPVMTNYLTTTTAAQTYQPIGTYLTAASLNPYSTTAQANALYSASNHNHTGVYQPVGNYLTAVPATLATFNYAADAGANDSYVISLNPAPAAYTAGMIIFFKANTANTTGCTINVNGLGTKNILKRVSTTPATGDILQGMLCMLLYDGTSFILLNPVVN